MVTKFRFDNGNFCASGSFLIQPLLKANLVSVESFSSKE